jgi:uncharacterized protein YlzI (FlbEa/FlbD family)
MNILPAVVLGLISGFHFIVETTVTQVFSQWTENGETVGEIRFILIVGSHWRRKFVILE